jgi:hypothetical protein
VLGFDDDERDYGVAVRMLQVLGCARVRLLTNNPAKLDGLSQAGIDVWSGPAAGAISSDNRRYHRQGDARRAQARPRAGRARRGRQGPVRQVTTPVAGGRQWFTHRKRPQLHP